MPLRPNTGFSCRSLIVMPVASPTPTMGPNRISVALRVMLALNYFDGGINFSGQSITISRSSRRRRKVASFPIRSMPAASKRLPLSESCALRCGVWQDVSFSRAVLHNIFSWLRIYGEQETYQQRSTVIGPSTRLTLAIGTGVDAHVCAFNAHRPSLYFGGGISFSGLRLLTLTFDLFKGLP